MFFVVILGALAAGVYLSYMKGKLDFLVGKLKSLMNSRGVVRVDGSEEKVGIVDPEDLGITMAEADAYAEGACDGMLPASEQPERPFM